MQYSNGATSKNGGGGTEKCGGHNLPPGRDRVNLSAKMQRPAVSIEEHP